MSLQPMTCSLCCLGSINQNEQSLAKTKKKSAKQASSVVHTKGDQTVGEITLIVFPLVCHPPSLDVHQYQI